MAQFRNATLSDSGAGTSGMRSAVDISDALLSVLSQYARTVFGYRSLSSPAKSSQAFPQPSSDAVYLAWGWRNRKPAPAPAKTAFPQ